MKKILFVSITLLLSFTTFSQEHENSIALVAFGEGQIKQEAEANALRSAIEQAYGTFVSADTQILNDEVVKNEIATVSSGNIQNYEVLSSIEEKSKWEVSIKAVVSINKLVDYVKAHGSSTEFAGQTFAMEMKMRKLNKENEGRALNHLCEQVRAFSRNYSLFDYTIQQGQIVRITGIKMKCTI